MRKWPGKYVIGLTGNIATGKSIVRKMLEHLGAYALDADEIAHRVISKGAPGYQPVLNMFGRWLLTADDEIDRQKLGRLVFADPQALALLEEIIHPSVTQAVDMLIQRSRQRIIVIEAIKLLESNLASSCDSLWTTVAPENIQLSRLMNSRSMTEAEALHRIRLQPPQDEKITRANVVINNDGTFEDTLKQVQAAWEVIQPGSALGSPRKTTPLDLTVKRGRPRDSQTIADLIARLSNGAKSPPASEILDSLGDKAYLLLYSSGQLAGLAAWQVENLVTRTTDIFVDEKISLPKAMKALIGEVEKASHDLQCEACLLFLSPELGNQSDVWKNLGYESRTTFTLDVQTWQDAARESMRPNTTLYFKQLRQDRVLRPI